MKNSYTLNFTHDQMLCLTLIMYNIQQKDYDTLKRAEDQPLWKEVIDVILNTEMEFPGADFDDVLGF